jgi:muconolactone delta-isomerase
MYFETVMHVTVPVESAAEAARRIHAKEVRDFDAFVWTANNRRLAVVADNHCNNSWLEVAVIDLDRNAQLESITAGWCDENQLRTHLELCETNDYVFRQEIELPLDGENAEAKADFECGCCGSGFISTYAKQRKYDQDNGFGICPKCAHYYGG